MAKTKVLFKMFYLYHKAVFDPLIDLFKSDPEYDVALSVTHEVERTFGLFDKTVEEDRDERLTYLMELRKFKEDNPESFRKIKNFEKKS